MEIVEKLIFGGTPAQLYAVLKEFEIDNFTIEERISFHHLHRNAVVQPDSPRIDIYCTSRPSRFSITALLCPDNCTRITVRAEQAKWDSACETWKKIRLYIEELGWIGKGELPAKEVSFMPSNWPSELERIDVQHGSQERLELYGLSDKERDIFNMAMAGKDRQHIADELQIAAGSVDSHIQHISEKLGLYRTKSIAKLRKEAKNL